MRPTTFVLAWALGIAGLLAAPGTTSAGSVEPKRCLAEHVKLCKKNRELTFSKLRQLPTADLEDPHPMSQVLKAARGNEDLAGVHEGFPERRFLFGNRKQHDARLATLDVPRYCKCSTRAHYEFLGPELFADVKCGTGPSEESVQKLLGMKYMPKRSWEMDLDCMRQHSR